jgi:pimeloyl-ACP methyl ester carboxylesterase
LPFGADDLTFNSSDFEVQSGDGRRLQVCVTGASDAYPVFLMHGAPGSRRGPRPRGTLLYRLGIKLISYDRPGYGLSDRAEGRMVVDAAHDVAAIVNALRIENFAVVGRSGGGPHALAVAALYPDLVSSVAALVPLAPYDARGLDWYEGMNYHNVREFMAVDTDTDPHFQELKRWAAAASRDPRNMLELLRSDLCKFDHRVVDDVALRRLLLATYKEGLRQGPGGWIDDVVAFRRPWGFELSEIRTRTLLWHGADDRFSPVEHTFWLHGQMTGAPTQATLHIEPEIGHFGAVEVLPDVLSWIVDGVSSVERSAFSRLRRTPTYLLPRPGVLAAATSSNGSSHHGR